MIKNYKNFIRSLGLAGVVAIFLIFPSVILAAEVPCASSGSVFIFCKLPGGTCTNAPLPEDQKNNPSTYCTPFGGQFVACADSVSTSPGICQLQEPGCCKMKQDVNTVGCSDGPAQNCAVPPNIFLPGASCSTYSDCAGKTQAATPTGCCQMQGSCSDNIAQKDCANTNANNTWAQGQYCSQGCKSPTTSGGSGGGTKLETVETNFTPVKPILQINIPTVNFSDIKVQGPQGERYVDIPYLAEYIKGVFNYALGFLAMLAVIMIMIGGVKYIMARGGGGVGEAKKMIGNAFFGLILGLASYVILNAVSPSLTNLSTIRTPYIERITADVEYPPPAEEPSSSGNDGSAPPPGGKVPFFGQYADPWGNKKPGDPEWPFNTTSKSCTTIRQRGCGTTSLAMVLKFYGKNVTPLDTAKWGLGCTGGFLTGGSNIQSMWSSAPWTDLTVERVNSDRAMQLAAQGKPIVFNCAPCIGFRQNGSIKGYGGHYMVLAGSDDGGQTFIVNDPGANLNSGIVKITREQVVNPTVADWQKDCGNDNSCINKYNGARLLNGRIQRAFLFGLYVHP